MKSYKNFRILYYSTVDSTNKLARQFAEQEEPEGLLVVADQQITGRGRGEKRWFSVSGESLTFSLLLRPVNKNPEQCPQLALILGLSLAQTMEKLGFYPQLKWPNDVYLNGKKIAGILLENTVRYNRLQWIVAGVGVNLNVKKESFPQTLQDIATSLFIEGGKEIVTDQFLQEFLSVFSYWYDSWKVNDKMQYLLDEYSKRFIVLGCTVIYEKQGKKYQAQMERIDENGGLWVIHQGDKHRLSWAEISITTKNLLQTQPRFNLDEGESR